MALQRVLLHRGLAALAAADAADRARAIDAADLARAAAQTKPAKLRDPSVSRQVQRQQERKATKQARYKKTRFRAYEVFDGFVPRGKVYNPARRFVEIVP